MTKLFKMILLLWLFSISSFAQDTWTVAGVSSIFGSEWAPTDTSNDMTSEDGVIFTLTKKDLSLSAGIVYEYKVVKNHSWDNESYGQDGGEPNKTFSVSQDGLYDLIITFNVNTKDLSERPIIKNWTGAEKAKAFYYVGSLNNWSTTDKSYPFTLLDDGKTWELTVTAVDNDGWFKIAPDFAYEKPSSFFDNLLCAPYDGCEELSGNMEYGNLGAWHLPQSDLFHSYTIRIIPLEMTYEIVPITIEKPNKIQIWQDPQTKVNYIYTVGESTASVKEGSSTAGSPDAIGNVAILSKFTVDGNEYTVTSIGSCAFQSCIGLTSVIIPYSVTTIGINAFSGCTGLTSITLSEGVTSIGNMAFEGCTGLTSVTIPESVTSIDSYAFSLCTGLTNITIPSSVTTIGYRAFYRCYGLTSVTIPEGITCIGPGAFEFCTGLTNVYIPESVTKIDYGAFSSCSGLRSLNLPKSVVSIGNFAFLGCTGLVSINLPEGLTNIGSQAFEDCTGLTSITIPSSVTNISYIAFSGCTNLKNVYCYAEVVPATSDNAFSNSSYKEATLYVPAASINAYKSTVPWSEFGSIKAMEGDQPPSKPGDVNGDGTVDVADIASVISIMASVGAGLVPARPEADVNGDGAVDVADIASIIGFMAGGVVEPNTPYYYQIPEEYLNGWDEGVVSSSDYYFVMKREDDEQGYVCYMNDKENSTLGLAFYFDNEFNLTEVVSEKGALLIDENFISYVDIQGNLISLDELKEEYGSRRNIMRALPDLSQIGKAIPVLNTLVTWIGRYNTAQDFFAGDWGNAMNGLTTDLAGTLVGSAIGGLGGATIGLGIGGCFYILDNTRNQLDEASVNLLLGSSQVEIIQVQRTGLYSYDITLSVSGLATRPAGNWSNRQVDAKAGVYIREHYPTVTHAYKTSQSNLITVSNDGPVTVSVTINNPHETYYVAPVLIPYNGSYPLTGYIRYGETIKLDVDIASVKSAKGVKCIYNGIYNGDLVGYDVEASIEASIVSVNEFSSWGVELYAQTPYSDYLEIQVLTAPLAVGSCTLKYQDILSEEYFDKTSRIFKLRAVPFAIRKIDNDKFEGEAYDFEIKVGDWTSCPDENHPHWIDLGIGTQWRCCNEGASRPEDYGGYYQFGQVASAPTLDQIKALVNNCSYTWTTQNGVNGGKFTGPNGGTIFLPAAGYVWDGELLHVVGSSGGYWSSTPYGENNVYTLYFYSGDAYWGHDWTDGYRYIGRTVRPVR